MLELALEIQQLLVLTIQLSVCLLFNINISSSIFDDNQALYWRLSIMAGKIVADTLEHSTAGSIATNYVVEGSAKAFCSTDGDTTIDDSLNISSATDEEITIRILPTTCPICFLCLRGICISNIR